MKQSLSNTLLYVETYMSYYIKIIKLLIIRNMLYEIIKLNLI